MLPLEYVERVKDFKLLTDAFVKPWNSKKIRIIAEGSVRVSASATDKAVLIKAKCIKQLKCPLLSYQDYLSLDGKPLQLPESYDVSVSAVDDTLGNIGTAKITVKSDVKPVVQGARKLAFRLHKPVEKEIQKNG